MTLKLLSLEDKVEIFTIYTYAHAIEQNKHSSFASKYSVGRWEKPQEKALIPFHILSGTIKGEQLEEF